MTGPGSLAYPQLSDAEIEALYESSYPTTDNRREQLMSIVEQARDAMRGVYVPLAPQEHQPMPRAGSDRAAAD
jgi:hypothetical protein